MVNVLVNGASLCRGPNSWPYFLSELCNFNLVNLSQAGAGNQYIHNSTMSELYERSYDLVIIMWTEFKCVDMQVEDISYFSSSPYTSMYQSKMNDWPEKIVYPFNDQEIVQKDWVFGVGHINGDKTLKNIKIFDSIYRYIGLKQLVHQSVLHMLSLQNTLKTLNIPYIFLYGNDCIDTLKSNRLYEFIDQNNVFCEDFILSITQRLNDFAEDKLHPGDKAHKEWALMLQKYINVNNII